MYLSFYLYVCSCAVRLWYVMFLGCSLFLLPSPCHPAIHVLCAFHVFIIEGVSFVTEEEWMDVTRVDSCNKILCNSLFLLDELIVRGGVLRNFSLPFLFFFFSELLLYEINAFARRLANNQTNSNILVIRCISIMFKYFVDADLIF